MAVVTIIREIVRTGIRLNQKYKYLNLNDKFIRKYVPPGYRTRATRLARIGEGVALGLPIYEAIESGLAGKVPYSSPSQFRQKRNRMEQSFSGRKYSKSRTDNYCYRPRRYKYRR